MKHFWTVLISLAIVLQFAHLPFENEWSWEIGWSVQDLTTVILSFGWYHFIGLDRPKLKAAVFLLGCWNLITFVANLTFWAGGPNVDHFVLLTLLLVSWIAKQVWSYDLPKESDPYNPDNYMIGAFPITSLKGFFSAMRPDSCSLHSGQMVSGGGNLWCIRKKRFTKLQIKNIDHLKDVIFIDTGIPVSEKIDSNLDLLIGKKAAPWVRDCFSLNIGVDVADVLDRRKKQ